MASDEIRDYYDITAYSEPREQLVKAVSLLPEFYSDGVAIDCGCGAGSSIAYLRERDLTVHGFDLEAESIERCQSRFVDDARVHLTQATFRDFDYPAANLIVADASLFFCPHDDFPLVWQKIESALPPGGIFFGGFLGPNDTMASDQYDKEVFWPDVPTFTEVELRPIFNDFEIIDWIEHEIDGKTAQGEDHHWHIFSVIAIKRS
ncbi:MAG: SAM-dependent methyltransferase [Candidatus Azotimanducaceae bacterium]|jgi:SAM-dependent methyltransferase